MRFTFRKPCHYLFIRNQFATVGGIDSDLHERHEVRFAFGNAANRFGGKVRPASPLRRSQPIDQIECFWIEARRDDCCLCHACDVIFCIRPIKRGSDRRRRPAIYTS